jgi:hypothetical protein
MDSYCSIFSQKIESKNIQSPITIKIKIYLDNNYSIKIYL